MHDSTSVIAGSYAGKDEERQPLGGGSERHSPCVTQKHVDPVEKKDGV